MPADSPELELSNYPTSPDRVLVINVSDNRIYQTPQLERGAAGEFPHVMFGIICRCSGDRARISEKVEEQLK